LRGDGDGDLSAVCLTGLRSGILFWLSPLRWLLKMIGLLVGFSGRAPSRPRALKALPWYCVNGRFAASGRSTTGILVGSYSFFCSRANMLLFLTRDACLSFSTDGRFAIVGDCSRSNMFSVLNREGEARPCQKACGERPLYGEGSNGEDSFSPCICYCLLVFTRWRQLAHFLPLSTGYSWESFS
jgi:hypothetical protein